MSAAVRGTGRRAPGAGSSSGSETYYDFTRPFTLLPPTLRRHLGRGDRLRLGEQPRSGAARHALGAPTVALGVAVRGAPSTPPRTGINQYYDIENDRRNKPKRRSSPARSRCARASVRDRPLRPRGRADVALSIHPRSIRSWRSSPLRSTSTSASSSTCRDDRDLHLLGARMGTHEGAPHRRERDDRNPARCLLKVAGWSMVASVYHSPSSWYIVARSSASSCSARRRPRTFWTWRGTASRAA